jgi:hypothetical protein
MNRSVRWLVVVAVIAACDGSGVTGPPLAMTTISGVFGTNGAELRADTTGATVELNCAQVTIARAIVTDVEGRFVVSGQWRRTGGAVPIVPESPTPVRVVGFATAGAPRRVVLSIYVIPEEPGAPVTPGETFTVVENKPATILLCP